MNNQINLSEVNSTLALGQLIRKHRKAQKMTLVDTAGLCGISVRFLSELENGRNSCSIGRIFLILHTLGLDMHLSSRSGSQD